MNIDNDTKENSADDPVVSEIPVFLSQKAAEYLCLVQYPLRKSYRSLHSDAVKKFLLNFLIIISIYILFGCLKLKLEWFGRF